MNFSDILNKYPPYARICENLNNTPISVSGVVESAQSQLIFALANKNNSSAVVVTYSDMEARAMYSDLSFYTDNAVYFPSKEYVFYNIETSARSNENIRLAAVDKLINNENCILVTSVDALLQYTADKTVFEEFVIEFRLGKCFELEKLTEQLIVMGYTREDIVEGEGQFSVRGGNIDIFSPNYENPLRIEFFDDETDSIRAFDAYSQRSLEKMETARVIPVKEAIITYEKKSAIVEELQKRIKSEQRKKAPDESFIENAKSDIESFNERHYFPSVDKYISMIQDGKISSALDFIDNNSIVFIVDSKRISERGKTFEWEKGEIISELKMKGIIGSKKEEFFVSYSDFICRAKEKKVIALETLSHAKTDFDYKLLENFTTKTTVSFHGKIDYLYNDLESWQNDGYTSVILASTRGRSENLQGVLKEKGIKASISDTDEIKEGATTVLRGNINKGFEYPEINFVLISDREIFETKKSRRKRQIDNANRIKSYNDINAGDYVVHAAHGIGQYMGTQKITVNNVTKDYLKIQYKGTDVLYVPIDQLNVLYKYVGNDTERQMKLNKLGGSDWNKTKQKVRKATEDLAQGLIKLYAERANAKGHSFSADTPWQREFEDTFAYQETEDQLRSIEEVKQDMESSRPMDRLLCGDVGFGKTEVAIRAAFKAVCDSKQVAYLCPTTVLAMQHYETFLKRMEHFPIKVEMLSRFRTATQQKKILKKLKTGEIDVVIGTHRLLSKDIEFRDLGLLIVDEEQRFGVAHKERLKEMKKDVDVLTMTATPIPRTLHMAMTSVRDMSVLTEPPRNRYPVQTYVLEDNPVVILDAIRKEIARGGQVFYLHNRVQGIYGKAQWIQSQFPDINVAVGHGKMNEEELEEIMYDMVNGKTDVLVCTTIIETGLDIPNANTIIIENADKMGLAQLYQLRGRVGRSNRAAYAYLTYHANGILSDVASKRLRAVKEFTEFGSGFKIAMRDLEIRGAGNILGAQQHGHMDSVGYDMYCKILQESINEAQGIKTPSETGVSIDINVNAYLPESYIENHNQRIDMYKRIAAIESDEDKFEIEDELIDRFGDIPKSVQNIIDVAALKIIASDCGVYEITQPGKVLQLKFVEDKIDAKTVFELDKLYPKQMKIAASEKPVLSFRLTDDDKNILEYTKNILSVISQIQSKIEKSDNV